MDFEWRNVAVVDLLTVTKTEGQVRTDDTFTFLQTKSIHAPLLGPAKTLEPQNYASRQRWLYCHVTYDTSLWFNLEIVLLCCAHPECAHEPSSPEPPATLAINTR